VWVAAFPCKKEHVLAFAQITPSDIIYTAFTCEVAGPWGCHSATHAIAVQNDQPAQPLRVKLGSNYRVLATFSHKVCQRAVHGLGVRAGVYVFVCMCLCVCVYMFVCMCVYVCVYMFVYTLTISSRQTGQRRKGVWVGDGRVCRRLVKHELSTLNLLLNLLLLTIRSTY